MLSFTNVVKEEEEYAPAQDPAMSQEESDGAAEGTQPTLPGGCSFCPSSRCIAWLLLNAQTYLAV